MNVVHFAEEPRHILCIFDGDEERVGNLIARVRFNGSYREQAEQLARQFAASDKMLAALQAWAHMLDLEEQLSDTDAPYPDIQGAYETARQLTRDVLATKLEGNNVKG